MCGTLYRYNESKHLRAAGAGILCVWCHAAKIEKPTSTQYVCKENTYTLLPGLQANLPCTGIYIMGVCVVSVVDLESTASL